MNRCEFLKSVAAVCAVAGKSPAPATESASKPETSIGAKLPQRLLGKTGVQVSALALGGVIGMQLPPSASHDPVAIAETALNLGVTYFDTAPSYNNGQSETNYGQVLARRRKEVFQTTKTGDRTYDGTMRSIEQSLKRLQTDHVDLIQIHAQPACFRGGDRRGIGGTIESQYQYSPRSRAHVPRRTPGTRSGDGLRFVATVPIS
jgi:hypothetical protein